MFRIMEIAERKDILSPDECLLGTGEKAEGDTGHLQPGSEFEGKVTKPTSRCLRGYWRD
jgi:hypothetical protein